MTAKKTTKKAPAKKVSKAGKPAAEKKPKSKADPKPKKPIALDVAAKVLGEAGAPMNCQEMITAMASTRATGRVQKARPGKPLFTQQYSGRST